MAVTRANPWLLATDPNWRVLTNNLLHKSVPVITVSLKRVISVTETMSDRISVLDIGAGEHPHPDATATLDIREDIDVDYPGVDIAHDEWPIDTRSVDRVICSHVLEHVPPTSFGHVFGEFDRILVDGGTAHITMPHAGTWAAGTDLTHQGTGGTTPDVDRYFADKRNDALERYWPDLDWNVEAYTDVEFPSFLRSSLRLRYRVESGHRSIQILKIPFTTAGEVTIKVRKHDR